MTFLVTDLYAPPTWSSDVFAAVRRPRPCGDELSLDAVLELVVGVLALDLVGDLVDARELVVGELARRRRRPRRMYGGKTGNSWICLGGLCCDLELSLDELLEERLRGLEALGDDRLVRAWWRRP